MQNCTCSDMYNLVMVNGTPNCQPSTVPGHTSISITVLVVVPALVIVFLLLDALGRLRRGSYEGLMLRWVRRRGPPGVSPNRRITMFVHFCHLVAFNTSVLAYYVYLK